MPVDRLTTATHRQVRTQIYLMLILAVLFAVRPASGQQTYVTRFDAFVGYAFLDSPHVGLFENGAQFQFGVRPSPWYSLGFDYSVASGNLTLNPSLLIPSLQQQLDGEIAELEAAHMLPPNYMLTVPAGSFTQTFAAGPQLAYRHYKKFTLFVRPSIGAIHETATPHPGDPFATAVAASLAPPGYKKDWTAFYGFGGGIDLLFSKHVALRIQADEVYDHLFNDLLKDGRFTTRFAIGPCFNFGGNIKK